MTEILRAATAQVVVVEQVVAEALYVLRPAASGLERVPIDITPEIQNGLLTRAQLSDVELATFVRCAAELDDGEAATISLASHRSNQVATDDRAVQNYVQRHRLPLTVVRTSDLVQRWVASVGASRREVVQVLTEIRDLGRFIPNELDPHVDWWRRLLERP